MEPAFRRSVSGKLSLADTTEAISIRSENRGRDYTKALPAAVVRKRAEAAVRRMNGDLNNKIHLLGQFTIQFGQFRNETFKWLVSNSLGYAAFIVVSSQNDPASADERWVNKMALKNYLTLFPEGLEAIDIKKSEKQGRQAPAKPQSKLVEAATDLMSDTDDNELSAMAEKIEFDLQASQESQSVKKTALVSGVTESPASDVQSSSEKSPVVVQKKPVRSVSGVAAKTARSLILANTPVTKHTEVGTDTQSMQQMPTTEGQSSLASRVVVQKKPDRSVSGVAAKTARSLILANTPVTKHTEVGTDTQSMQQMPTTEGQSSLASRVVVQKKPVRSVSGVAAKTARSLILANTPVTKHTEVGTDTQSMQQTPTTEGQSSLASRDEESMSSTSQLLSLAPYKRDQSSTDTTSQVPLLKKWRTTLPQVDHSWVSSALFVRDSQGDARMDLSRISGLWLYPPQAPLIPQSVPKLHDFFGHRVFIWMPIKLWSLRVACPHQDCRHPELSHAGVYQVVRQVLDVSNFYNLVSETLWCKKCKRKMVSWSHSILSQLDIGHRSHFPCLLTTMKACDTKVAILMRQRGLGNSASQIQKKVKEQHSTEWYQKTIQYLSACKSVASAASSGLIVPQRFQEPPPMAPIPQYRWLMQVYVQDVLQRLSEVKANITSVFGRILKVDSTKKVTKKLAGPSAGTAEWATNVGNEYGQVLISVLTAGEGRFGLHRMAKGLMKRFADAGQPSPEVLYVDRDCCGPSNIKLLFADWQDIHVRLDVWHFMRRFSCGCYTDSHPLYGLFMKKLGHCIFAWDNDDLQALKAAKRSELVSRHVQNPSEDLIMGSITKNELALHCRRQTRGVDETTLMIEALIDAFDGEKGRDTLGTPLINSRRMREEWEGQKKHVACLQDPDNVQLYIKTGSLKKGGHTLPTYRSCRGSTSLESFHLHLNRFIPGTLANDTVFQAYLVDGLSRWNQDRASVLTSANEPQTYSGLLRFTANKMTQEIFQKHISAYTPPRKYTGELIGIEYLYDQTGRPLQEYDDDILQMEDTGLDVPEDDDGFHELEAEDMTIADFSVFEPNVCDQSEPLGLSPGTKRGTQQKQLKHDAPVIQQPTSVTTVCDQSEPFEMSPGTSTEQRDTPVTGQKTSATIGAQFESPSPGTAKTPVLHYPTDDEYINTAQPSSESVGPDHIAGYDKVQALAAYLADLRHGNMCLTSAQVEEIVQLWSALDDYDKQPIIFRPVFAQHSKGRFRAKRQGAPGVESTERSMRGPDSVPATRPDCNRYVEAVIDRLCSTFPGSRRREGHVLSRWTLILEAYSKIKTTVISSPQLTSAISIQLPDISQKTLKAWNNDKARDETRHVLYQGIRLPEIPFTARKELPDPQMRPRTLPSATSGISDVHQFHLPLDTSGTVVHTSRMRRIAKKNPEQSPPPPPPTVPPVLEQPSAPQFIASATPIESVPYTTHRYRKRKQLEESAGHYRRSYKQVKPSKNCKKCGQIIEKPGHLNYFGNLYCANSETRTYEEWKIQFQDRNYGKKK